MDPISIIVLVSTCTSLAARIVTTTKQIDDFLESYKEADRALASLLTTLRMSEESLTQMRSWLDQEPSDSYNLRRVIKDSVNDCEVVLEYLEKHIASVLGSARRGDRNSALVRLKLIWNAKTISKHEARLNSQMQTVMLLITFVELNNTDKQDAAFEKAETKTIISRSANEARHIRKKRDGSTIRGGETGCANVGDCDRELDVDDELIRSLVYVAQYHALMQGKPSSFTTDSAALSPSPADPEDNVGSSSRSASPGRPANRPCLPLKLSFRALKWAHLEPSPKSRNLASRLCQAASTGNVRWIESSLKGGAYINAWAITDVDGEIVAVESSPRGPSEHFRRTPLMLAAMKKRHEAFSYLLGRGADLQGKDSEGRGVWNYLAAYDPDFCAQLIRSGSRPPLELLWSLLCQAVDAETVDLLGLLLTYSKRSHLTSESADISSFSSKTVRGSIFYRAMQKGSLEMVKLRGDKVADVDEGPTHMTVRDWGTEVEIGFSALGSSMKPTPLFSVVGNAARLEMVKYIVSRGARIKVKTCCRVGWSPNSNHRFATHVTPLHVARGACAEFLISQRASVFAVDNENRTPLFWAIDLWKPEPDLEAVLTNLAHESPPNFEDKDGNRPLPLVAERVLQSSLVSAKTIKIYLTITRALLNAGAEPLELVPRYSDIYQQLDQKRTRILANRPTGWIIDPRFVDGNNKIKFLAISSEITEGSTSPLLRADDRILVSGQVHFQAGEDKTPTEMLGRKTKTPAIVSRFVELCNLLLRV